jgi:hypothetical protein
MKENKFTFYCDWSGTLNEKRMKPLRDILLEMKKNGSDIWLFSTYDIETCHETLSKEGYPPLFEAKISKDYEEDAWDFFADEKNKSKFMIIDDDLNIIQKAQENGITYVYVNLAEKTPDQIAQEVRTKYNELILQ